MANSKKLRVRRNFLWSTDPHCRKCGVETLLPEHIAGKMGMSAQHPDFTKEMPPELLMKMATIEHVYSRLHPSRRKITKGVVRTTLWCSRCNNMRSRKEFKELDPDQ